MQCCTGTEDEEEELLILRPVGPGIQDLETGDVVAAASALNANSKRSHLSPLYEFM